MNQYQFRAIRNSFNRDKIYCSNEYHNNYFYEGLMGKKIEDIKPNKAIINKTSRYYQKCINGGNTYLWYDIGTFNKSIYVITKNDIIIYWTTSSISAPMWSAWHILTNSHIELDNNSCWLICSPDKIDYYYYLFGSTNFKEEYKKVNTKIITTKDNQNKLSKLYYHT